MNILIRTKRPYFAEFPYYLWGDVNYDSFGNCKFPTDRYWTKLCVQNRNTFESFEIEGQGTIFQIKTKSRELEKKIAKYLVARCDAKLQGETFEITDWDFDIAVKRTEKIIADFGNIILQPFDNYFFWGAGNGLAHLLVR